MTLRPPQNLTTHIQSRSGKMPTGADILQKEILAEHSATLGFLGKTVETAMAAWHHRDRSSSPAEQEHLLEAATNAVYHYFIQREAIGATNHEHPIKFYEIPDQILARLGAQKPNSSTD